MADYDFYLAENDEMERAVFRPYGGHRETPRIYKVLPSFSDSGRLLITIQESRGAGVPATDKPNRVVFAAVAETLRKLEDAGRSATSIQVELI